MIIGNCDDGSRGEVWDVLGELIVCKVSGKETFHSFSVVEETSPPLNVMFSYLHRATDKIFYVLARSFTYLKENTRPISEGKKILAQKGDTIPISRGISHHFRNLSDQQSKLLVLITPERF